MSDFSGRTRRRGMAMVLGAALTATLVPLTAANAAVGDPRDLEEACSGAPSAADDFSDYAFLRDEEETALDCLAADGWRNIASGKEDGSYAPNETVSRAQMATFIARLLQAAGQVRPSTSSLGNAFGDDDPGTATGTTPEHHHNINWLYELGVVDGRPDTRDIDGDGDRRELVYDAHAPVLRDQMAKFIHGALVEVTNRRLADSGDPFPSEDCDSSLEDDVNALAAANIVQGGTDGRYDCDGNVRRGTMLLFLARPLDHLVEQGFANNPFVGTDRDFLVTPASREALTFSTSSGADADRGRREYVARVGSATVDIALVPAEYVTSEGGRTVFRDLDASPGLADGLGATGAAIETVHGGTVSPRNDRVDGVRPSNGEVRFTVDSSTANEEVVPVIWEDSDDDDELDLSPSDAPVEPFGIGGATLWIPLEAAENSTATFEVVHHSAADRFVTSPTATYYYGDAREVLYTSGGHSRALTTTGLANFLNGRDVNVAGAVRGDTLTVAYKQGTDDRTTVTMVRDVPGTVRSLGSDWTDTDGDGVGDDVVVGWRAPANPDVAGFDVYRSKDGAPFAFLGSAGSSAQVFAHTNVAAGTYRYRVLARNAAGDRGLDDDTTTVVVPSVTVARGPVSVASAFANDRGTSLRVNEGDVLSFSFEHGPLALAGNAAVVLRDADGTQARITNGVNGVFSLDSRRETLRISVTGDPVVLDRNAGDDHVDSSTLTVVESATGIVNRSGSWNLAASGCVSDANGCPFRSTTRVLPSRTNAALPDAVDVTDVAVDLVNDRVTVLRTASQRSDIQTGDTVRIYDVDGHLLGSVEYTEVEDRIVTLGRAVDDEDTLYLVYTDEGPTRDLPSQTTLVSRPPIGPVLSGAVANSRRQLHLTFSTDVVKHGPASNFRLYDADNLQHLAEGVEYSVSGNTATVTFDVDVDDAATHTLRIAQDTVRNPANGRGNDPVATSVTLPQFVPFIESVVTDPGNNRLEVRFVEPVSCPGNLASWSFGNQSVDEGGDGQASGAPASVTQPNDRAICYLNYGEIEPGDFGTLAYNRPTPGVAVRAVDDTSETGFVPTTTGIVVIDGLGVELVSTLFPNEDGIDARGGSNEIVVHFSEPVRCDSIQTSDFSVHVEPIDGVVRGPFDPAVTAVCVGEGPNAIVADVTITVSQAPMEGDEVTVTIVGQILEQSRDNQVTIGSSATEFAEPAPPPSPLP